MKKEIKTVWKSKDTDKVIQTYSFVDIPQQHRFIKIGVMNQKSDRQAINTAKKINPEYDYQIKIRRSE